MCSVSYSLENADMKGEGGQNGKGRRRVKEGAYLYLIDNTTFYSLRVSSCYQVPALSSCLDFSL